MSARRTRLRRSRRTHRRNIVVTALGIATGMFILLLTASAAMGAGLVQTWLSDLPDPDAPGAFEVARPTKIYSADGKLLARLYLENREVIQMSRMSTDLVDAVIAVEDERFYQHKGVDPVGLMRAAVVNLTQGFGTEGASTITQQYIRNTILLDERTEISIARKVREAYLALELERRYSKDEILEMYLNAIYFGQGAYGAQAASRAYFAKDASELTLAEAALLAGLPQQPSRLDPYANPKGATARRNEVLRDMHTNGYITAAELKAAKEEPVRLKRARLPEDGIYLAPYFVAHVKKELQAKFSESVVFKGGLVVRTTLDTRMQAAAEEAVKDGLGAHGPEGALVSIDPRNGQVKALVGGRNYRKNKFNLATQGHRQAGSAFKTFTLVTAINEGMPPDFGVDSSSPARIPTKPTPWVVANSEGAGHGIMSLSSATHRSVNTVFARVAWEIGAKKIVKMAKAMGIDSKLPAYPSITLGTGLVSPYEMASAYGTLATGGIHNEPIVITRVTDSSGRQIFTAKKQSRRAVRPEVAAVATKTLKGVITNGTGTRARIGRPAAGKTGTSQDYRDVWFVGYTPQLVTSVWVGHRTEKTIYVNGARAFGGTVCAPIWAQYMKKALKGYPELDFPKADSPKYNRSKFKIAVSKPPQLTGEEWDSVKQQLSGRKTKIEYIYSSAPKGTVVQQYVKDGTIYIRVSKGPKPAAPPPTDSGGGDTGGGDTGGGDTGGGDTTTTPSP